MLSSLMNFEIRSSMKYLGALWVAVLAASMMFGFAGKTFDTAFSDKFGSLLGTVDIIFTFIFWAAFVAMLVGTIVVIILRFYKGLLGEEGYLMHTLPVKTWELITSKGLVAAGLVFVSTVVAILSIMVSTAVMGHDVWGGIRDFLGAIGECPLLVLLIFEGLIILLVGILAKIYEVYASMSIGQMVGKHRVLTSLGAYIGIEIALDILGVILINIGIATNIGSRIEETFCSIPITADPSAYIVAAQPEIIGLVILVAIELAVFHVVTERILSKRLNLQ